MIVLKIALWIVLSAVGVIAAFFLCCIIVGFVIGVAEALGIRRKPKFKIVRSEEEE